MPIRILKKDQDTNREKGLKKSKMLVGGQAKLDKNKNNKIDAEDFKILKREKAKGRGQGLQDEKMKPGKPMKAALGAIALGLGAKKMMKKKGKAMPAGMGAAAFLAKKKQDFLGKKMGGEMKKDPSKPVNPFQKRPQKKTSKLKKVGKFLRKAGRVGAALGSIGAGAGVIAAAALRANKKQAEKKNKKMGGGMMQRPGYNVGGSVTVKTKLGRNKPTKMY